MKRLLGLFLFCAFLLGGCASSGKVRDLREPTPIVIQNGLSIWVIRRVPTATPAPTLQMGSSRPTVLRETLVIMLCDPQDPPVCNLAQVRGSWEEAVWPYMKSVTK